MKKVPTQHEGKEGLLHHRKNHGPDAFEFDRECTLASFVGEERRPDVFAALRTPTPSIGELVDDFMSRHFTSEQLIFDKLKEQWAQIVGMPYATMLRPLNINRNCLTVEASNATVSYAYCNPAMQRAFLAKLKSQAFDEITQIRVVLPGRR